MDTKLEWALIQRELEKQIDGLFEDGSPFTCRENTLSVAGMAEASRYERCAAASTTLADFRQKVDEGYGEYPVED